MVTFLNVLAIAAAVVGAVAVIVFFVGPRE
jgi:hypothetical protein